MAITKGINGTWSLINDPSEEPVYIRKFKKTVPVDGAWEDRVFYEMTQFPLGRQQTQDLLKKHYGPGVYSVSWWSTFNGIAMSEKIYIHYKLLE